MTLAGGVQRGRVAALAIFALLLVLIWVGPAAAYLGLIGSGDDAIEQHAALLQRYQALAEAPNAAAPHSAALELLLPEIPESQAVARLQETVKAIAAAAQVQVQNLQVLRAETLPGAVKIGVRVRGTGDIGALGRLLYAVEASRPLLLSDNLQVQAHPTSADATTAPLDFQLDVAAFKPGAS